jgi:hypothetical protein
MRGKWSKGIEPRNFSWIVKEAVAISERPGGHTSNHRRVRRHEEIIWIREHGFQRVISLMASPHNLHAYEELNLPYQHVPFGPHEDPGLVLKALYPQLRAWHTRGDRVLIHQDEISDRLQGVVGGYLLYAGMLSGGPQAITVIESLMGRQLGSVGREIMALAAEGI